MSGPVTRTASVLLAGALGVLAPGLNPLAVAQPPAEQADGWRPPPVNMDLRPDGSGGKPLKDFDQQTACISSSDDLSDGKLVQRIPWGQQYLRIDKVHEIMRAQTDGVGVADDGKPVTVAVIDTGVRPHRWLTVREGGDYVREVDPGAGLKDCDGHGTLVAGIIAAHTPPNIGFKGVAPDAEIFSIRQSSSNFEPKAEKDKRDKGQGDGAGSLSSLANAVVFAAKQDEMDVMNISIDNCNPRGKARSTGMARLQAAIHWAVDKRDVVVVASSGNTGEKCEQNNKLTPRTIVAPPWFDKDVLSVAAINEQGGVAEFSMHGPWVDVAAPGTRILSLDPASNGLANRVIENDKAVDVQGTSFAAPYVSGLAALVRAQYPNLDAYEVMHRIQATAQHPAAPGGHSQYVGYGVINPVAALTTSVMAVRNAGENTGPVPADLPEPAHRDWTPVVVALGGAGGALAALLITLFIVHTVRRNRTNIS